MCGIAGVITAGGEAPVEIEELRRMIAVLGHRGPDGHGFYRDARVGLAHARLSIIDLAGGFQPLSNEDGSVWLTFNGEIFNYLELRRELAARGHRFRTDGDSEVIVHAYEQYGPRAWERLNGQFAFGLWDLRRRSLWLVRDRFGILPLHYARAGPRIAFGSEAKALFAGGAVHPEVDPAGIASVFTRWSVASPGSVFTGVRTVRPGTALCIDDDLTEREHRYWAPDLEGDPESASLSTEVLADRLGDHLTDAVRLRLRADVPVGAYLSGGLDSSVIASRVQTADRSPLETFAVRFTDPRFDETAEQRRMAALLGTAHHEILCQPGDIATALQDVVWHCETPLLRTAPVPLFLLSGLVRERGMKVVLTGEGADELLAGYGIFKEDAIRRFWARQPSSHGRPALFARVHEEVDASGTRDSELWARFFGRDLHATNHPFYSHLVRWRNTAWTARVLAPELRGCFDVEAMDAALEDEVPEGWRHWSPLGRAQWLEIQTFMSPYLLSGQGDRVAMAHGVEVRYPFLDPRLVDWCFGLPDRAKLIGLRDKVVLRRLASRNLPAEIWSRPKQPYRAPMTAPLFASDAPSEIGDALSEAELARSGMTDPRAAGLLVAKARRAGGRLSGEREEMALVGLLTLQMLHRAYFEEMPARAADARRRLGATPPVVLEDRVDDQRTLAGHRA